MKKDESVVEGIKRDLSWANDKDIDEDVTGTALVNDNNPWSLAEQQPAAVAPATTPTVATTSTFKRNENSRNIPSIATTTPNSFRSTERGNSTTLLFSLPRFWGAQENASSPLQGQERSSSTTASTAVSSSSAPLFYNRYVNDATFLDNDFHDWSDTRGGDNYNTTIAAARAQAFRTRVYIGIYRALCVLDGLLGLLLLLYALALWIVSVSETRRHNEHQPGNARIAHKVAWIVSIWGIFLWFRVLLVLVVLSRSTRPSDQTVPWYCVGTWRLATVLMSALLAVCYGITTVWLLWDCSTCHSDDHFNATLYSFENDSSPESVLVRHHHCTAAATTTTCQGGEWTAWLLTHQHELLLPHYWVSYLEQSLLWTMLGLAALECTRAVYAQCTLSFHFPPNEHNNESSHTLVEPLLAMTMSSSWHDEAVVPSNRRRQWWRTKRATAPTPRGRDNDDEDAHLFAALSDDWADRARDDPLWWSRDETTIAQSP
jgi:hypothetical protein